MTCTHPNFHTEAHILRRETQVTGGTVYHFQVEIQVYCSVCGVRFQFLDLPISAENTDHPHVLQNRTKVSLPISPYKIGDPAPMQKSLTELPAEFIISETGEIITQQADDKSVPE